MRIRVAQRQADCLQSTPLLNHASSILSKLGVPNRTRAVRKALELGYI